MPGKKLRDAKSKLPKEPVLLAEAISLVRGAAPENFDATVEVHARLGIDPRKAEQQIRSTVALPHGSGKKVRVIAFAEGDAAKKAKEAGAVEAGGEELVEKIAGGWLDFDVAVATPDSIRSLGKIAKTLGTKGLMPNAKAGTVSPDPAKVVAELVAGRIEFRNDDAGIVHSLIGKKSFSAEQLLENAEAFFAKLNELKPSSSKGVFLKSVSLATTMGPGVAVKTSGHKLATA